MSEQTPDRWDGGRAPGFGSPKRSLGQVFLNSQGVVAKIGRALGATPADHVIEIGPGRGAMTSTLAASCGRLTLIEKDSELAEALRERFAGDPRVTIVEADATTVDLGPLVEGDAAPARVAGNLPYNAGGPILFNLLRQRRHVGRLVLMFQKEVAHRIAARPGDRDYGALSLHVQVCARADLLFDVPPKKFVPPPKVWSAVVRLEPFVMDHPAAAAIDDPRFERLVHALHAQPRKTVLNSLADGLPAEKAAAGALLDAAGIDPATRPSCVAPRQAMDLWVAWAATAPE